MNIYTNFGADGCAFHTRTDRLGEEVVAQQLQVQRRLCVTPSADVFSLDEEGEKTLFVFCLFPPLRLPPWCDVAPGEAKILAVTQEDPAEQKVK